MFELDLVEPLETLASAARFEHVLPMLVAVRGRITTPEPAKCELSGAPAVFRQLVEEEVYYKEHTNGRLSQECFEVRREQEQREAFLEDRSGSVRVESLQQAEGLQDVMETKQTFTPVDVLERRNLLSAVLHKAFKAMVKAGVRCTEHHLPLNTTVTLVGELVRDGVGRPRPLHAPHTGAAGPAQAQHEAQPLPAGEGGGAAAGPPEGAQAAQRRDSGAAAGTSGRGDLSASLAGAAAAAGAELLGQAAAAAVRALPYTLRMPAKGPFLVTHLPLPHLRASMEVFTWQLRAAGWGFGVLGAVLVARKVVLQLWRAREQRRIKRLLADAEAARLQRLKQQGGAPAGDGGDGDGRHVDDGSRVGGTCVVCLDRDSEVVFSACGHMCACFACSTGLRRCPICRVPSRMIRVYRP